MSSYTGLYVQRLTTGHVHGVQVDDGAGIENSLNPDVYTARGIQPPIDQLPDIDIYFAARRGSSPVILNLARALRGQPVTDVELGHIVHHGFAMEDGQGRLQLTEYGKQTLRDNGL